MYQIHLHDSFTNSKRYFTPIDPKNVRMYCCGPTVYSRAHIGNARPVVVFDTLFRLLRHIYGEAHVFYARNLTDIDDKIIAAADQTGRTIEAVTEETIAWYHDDMSSLGALSPSAEPRATAYVGEMIAMIEILITKGHAYAADGHVLFQIGSMPDHGGLSKRNMEDMIAGARVEKAPYKRDPADFVLWKPSNAGQPGWESPWGRGRPGWHIECSAMSGGLLGPIFDIHASGQDLIFPHHENEIAQSRCAHGTDRLANYWLHNGFVTTDGGRKMAKSENNFFTVHDLTSEGYAGEAVRLALLAGHYRQPIDITRESIKAAKAALDRLYGALPEEIRSYTTISPDIMAALGDDLNTPAAIAALHRIADEIYKAEPNQKAVLQAELKGSAHILGLLEKAKSDWFQIGATLSATEIETLVTAREAARKARDFARADEIRARLAKHQIVVEDRPEGAIWKIVQ